MFVEEQEHIRELVGKSTLPTFTVDISDSSVPNAVEKIADWLEESGGLYMHAG